jgi:hypothetical protein
LDEPKALSDRFGDDRGSGLAREAFRFTLTQLNEFAINSMYYQLGIVDKGLQLNTSIPFGGIAKGVARQSDSESTVYG